MIEKSWLKSCFKQLEHDENSCANRLNLIIDDANANSALKKDTIENSRNSAAIIAQCLSCFTIQLSFFLFFLQASFCEAVNINKIECHSFTFTFLYTVIAQVKLNFICIVCLFRSHSSLHCEIAKHSSESSRSMMLSSHSSKTVICHSS